MLNFNKQLILATLTLTSLFNGLANVQAIIQAIKRTKSDVDSKRTCSSDAYSSLATPKTKLATVSLDLDEKKSLAESDEVKVTLTAYDGSSLPIPLNLFSLSEVIQASKKDDEDNQQTISLVHKLLKKVEFQNLRELMLFKKALSLIKDGNKTNMFSRLTVQQLSQFFSKCHLTKEEAFNLFSISEYLQIGQLNSALAHFFANTPFIASVLSKTSESISHHIMRERLYAAKLNATDFSNFLEDDGFLPTTVQLPATFYLPEDSDIISLQEKVKHLWDQLKGKPECNQLIQQLPPSHLKAFLIEKIIYANIGRIDRPDFDMMYWYLQLPRGRGPYSLRERVLTTLRQKATAMVAGAEQSEEALQALKDTLAQLPEGWFTMELRRIYHERHHGQLIDAVAINNIMERINITRTMMNMQCMNLTMPLKSIIDLVIIHNEIHPIKELWLSYNQLTGSIPASIAVLGNLRELILDNNQLTGQIPTSIGNLHYLITLYLDNNQLDTTSEASIHLIKQLKTRVNPVYVST